MTHSLEGFDLPLTVLRELLAEVDEVFEFFKCHAAANRILRHLYASSQIGALPRDVNGCTGVQGDNCRCGEMFSRQCLLHQNKTLRTIFDNQ